MSQQDVDLNQRIFDTSIDLILVTDHHGNFVRVSPSSVVILGYSPSEMTDKSATGFIYPDDLDSTRDEMRAARRGKIVRFFECRYVHKNGAIVYLNWTGVWDPPTERHFFIGRDVTEVKLLMPSLDEINMVLKGIQRRISESRKPLTLWQHLTLWHRSRRGKW